MIPPFGYSVTAQTVSGMIAWIRCIRRHGVVDAFARAGCTSTFNIQRVPFGLLFAP